jgi:cellulose 1,4-beta-cellobiosidase
LNHFRNGNSITDSFCAAQKNVFGDQNSFADRGGLKTAGQALDRGMVLAFSISDDPLTKMLWLDSSYPLDRDRSQPGVSRGPCPVDSGITLPVEPGSGSLAYVTFSNIKFGDIGTTYSSASFISN